jgi:tryptophan-rich sensory protein
MEKRLEAGWLQRIAWSVLAWGSLGLLVWVPFLYVAIRRGRGSDWGAFAAFAFYECVTLSWSPVTARDSDPVLGAVVVLCLLTATAMLLFAVFDRRRPEQRAQPAYGAPPSPAQGQAYGYPYGR